MQTREVKGPHTKLIRDDLEIILVELRELVDGNDEQLEDLYSNKLHGLQEFVDPKSFKTYDELKDKLNKVLTGTSVRGTVETFTPKTSVDKAVEKVKDVETEDDATLQYFAKLADEA